MTDVPTDTADRLADQVADLRARVELLETAVGTRAADDPTTPSGSAAPASTTADAFWALEGLRARRDEHPATADGLVMLTGSLELPTGEPVEWQQGAATGQLIDTDWSANAAALAALGHPVRLELLRQVLQGVRTTSALANELGSTGQLHHHVRQLVSAGWLAQRGRGSYEVPVARVVPLLAILTGVTR